MAFQGISFGDPCSEAKDKVVERDGGGERGEDWRAWVGGKATL